jgi:hypothetical protein
LGKKFYNSLKNGPHYFLPHFKNKIIYNFVKFVAAKKLQNIVLLFSDPGSEIRDPGWVKIRIWDLEKTSRIRSTEKYALGFFTLA